MMESPNVQQYDGRNTVVIQHCWNGDRVRIGSMHLLAQLGTGVRPSRGNATSRQTAHSYVSDGPLQAVRSNCQETS